MRRGHFLSAEIRRVLLVKPPVGITPRSTGSVSVRGIHAYRCCREVLRPRRRPPRAPAPVLAVHEKDAAERPAGRFYQAVVTTCPPFEKKHNTLVSPGSGTSVDCGRLRRRHRFRGRRRARIGCLSRSSVSPVSSEAAARAP